MDIVYILKAVLRRWLIVLAMLALTGVVTVLVLATVEPSYQMSGSFLLTGAGGRGASQSQGGAGFVDAQFVQDLLQNESVRRRAADEGANAPYSVEGGSSGAVVRISSVARRADDAVITVDVVLGLLDGELTRVFDATDTPPSERSRVVVLNRPEDAAPSRTPDGSFVATATVVLRPSVASRGSPLAPSAYTARLLEELARSPAFAARAKRGAAYQVRQRERDVAPILVVTAAGSDSDAVAATFSAVRAALDELLESRQEARNVLPEARTVLQPLNVPLRPGQTAGDKLRPAIGLVGLGSVAAASAAVLVDGAVAARRRREEEALAASRPAPEPIEPPPAPRPRPEPVEPAPPARRRTRSRVFGRF